MFSRIRVALGMALLVSLLTAVTAFAKGNFSFLSITGGKLKEEIRTTDPALTTDFLIFFDFSQVKAEAPADPGVGYLITRYYVDNGHEIAFDELHYYPDTSLVYYDGIVNGFSEYDDKWYTARPGVKTVFESALLAGTGSALLAEKKQPAASAPQPDNTSAQSQPVKADLRSLPIVIFVIAAGLAALFAFAFWQRRSSIQ